LFARFSALAVSISIVVGAVLSAQSLTAVPHADPPPADLADSIEALMAPSGARVDVGGKTLEFWWVKSMPLVPSSTEVGWSAVEEGTLVGAVSLTADFADARGATVKRGIYTLRYGAPPLSSDDATASRHHFLLLSAADADNSTATLGHDGVLSISRQSTGGARPPAWALDAPPQSNARGIAGFSVPASRDGQDVGVLKFGLVLVGAGR
jgi:hypothetical protein